MRAGDAADSAGVSVKALRYYEDTGLLRPARHSNGYRDYTEQDVRLAFEIRTLMSLGLTTQETRPFLDCLRAGHEDGDDCPESLAAYQHKIDDLDRMIARRTGARHRLVSQMHAAAGRGFAHQHKENLQMLPAAELLPEDLPAPKDDGAANHLPGRVVPSLTFQATDGDDIALDAVSAGRWVLFLYPLTGDPGVDMPRGWDQIPGARGCSQEACAFGTTSLLCRSTAPSGSWRCPATMPSTSRTSYGGCTCPIRCCPTPRCGSPERWTCRPSRQTAGRCTSASPSSSTAT
ncbi:hypothetical protein BH24ACT15_BH24ACT15_30250 [soil metagenome]